MALTPESFIPETNEEETEEITEPSKTWAIDFANGTIGGYIDEELALRQFVIKALLTERSKYAIYSDDYGNELQELVGEDFSPALLDSEIPRMVYEALAYDERIEDIADIEYTRSGDKLYVSFTVVPVAGVSQFTEEVAI
ncbi:MULTISPECIES: DUF2634 domain-containing protein [Peribacillus]|uniref:DUF2634 domain-containing protein n=1 Tax=Peribacillus TaxID=2675229 RepID=UPI001F4DB774|nr:MULTISPECIES: DUF2634 domain-containing protein [unclassified Peribacillus]MCK1985161.1 DUF2634 domain-containing protein [Peribacillus sp. Aquil_B1]MCK2007189.1 DUF2634 domain-containing protein [Peribacillus sp. Aquil_B8]